MTADELMVKCKGCYTPFAVPEQIDREAFAAASLPTSSIQCPHCRIRRPYDKSDYFFASEAPEFPF